MIHHCNHQAFIILVLFTVPFYHFLFSRNVDLTKRHFSSDILVPFPDFSDQYSRANHLNSGRCDRSSRIFSTTWGMGASSQKFAHSSHLEKKFPFPHGKSPSKQTPLSPVPPNTTFLFPQASKPKPLNWQRHIEKQHWD